MKKKNEINETNIDIIKRKSQSIAILELIIMTEWEFRYFSYNSNWDTKEEMASMRDGCGNHYFILFNEQGMIIKGYDKRVQKNKITIKRILRDIPSEFQSVLNEPAFIIEKTNFCIWAKYDENKFNGSTDYLKTKSSLINMVLGTWDGYRTWATDYYEREIDSTVVKDIFQYLPLNSKIISKINNSISIEDIETEISEIGYPYKV